jgi:hypothetical protein
MNNTKKDYLVNELKDSRNSIDTLIVRINNECKGESRRKLLIALSGLAQAVENAIVMREEELKKKKEIKKVASKSKKW